MSYEVIPGTPSIQITANLEASVHLGPKLHFRQKFVFGAKTDCSWGFCEPACKVAVDLQVGSRSFAFTTSRSELS